MRNMDVVSLLWQGAPSIDAARQAIAEGSQVEMVLPPDTHHALFVHLYPGAERAAPEDFDVSDGPRMLLSIASVAGLQPLRELEGALRRSRYRLRLTSPPPVLRLTPASAVA